MEKQLEIRQIEFGTSEYEETLKLRDKVLRKPLGLSIKNDDLQKENEDYHVACFLNSQLAGIIVLTKIADDTEIKIKQIAVEESFRGCKIGSKLVNYAEKLAKNLGYKKLLLHSRETAVPFYKKLGYGKTSGAFIEVTIPHYKMEKQL